MPLEQKIARDEVRFWGFVRRGDGCWEWTGSFRRDGYGRFASTELDDWIQAHRFSMRLMLGRVLTREECVCHRCDNRKCVRPDHLFIGTLTDNNRDTASKGRQWLQGGKGKMVAGEANPNSKLTAVQVAEIRVKRNAGQTLASIGKQYGVTAQAVWQISRGENWSESACQN